MTFTPSDSRVLGRYLGNDNTPPTQAEIDMTRLLAASALIVKLERICSLDVLSDEDEADGREIICKACRAFNIPSIAERPLESSSAVERLAVNEDVAGSKPASPANVPA